MRKILMAGLLYFIFLDGYAQENIYDASTLSDSLIKNAHSVKREEIIDFNVKDRDQATLSVHQVFTVLDAEGEHVLFFKKWSDEFAKITDAEIKVFDAKGKLINRYKMKELKSLGMGEGLVVDGKVYYFQVAAPSFPVTVEYDYEKKFKGTLNYPDYQIQTPEQSVEHSKMAVSVPFNLDLRFKPQHISLSPSVLNKEKNKIYTWEVKDLASIPYEEGSVSYESSYPAILLAPNKFSMDGNDGDLSTWKSFGEWYAKLSKGSLNLSEGTQTYLQQLVKNAKSDQEKIEILYHYLQKNTRYVSIQLGIGGFKPFDAAFVDSKKYGDCKALANYMQAMLKCIGIVSYPALINAEYDKQAVDPAFPHNSFNHVILCVPLKNDTTWLECTSDATDAGVLGSFTENRNALLITPQGGVLIPTPRSNPAENTSHLKTRLVLNDDASGKSESVMESKGEYKEEIINYLMNEKKDDQKNYLVRRLGFTQPDAFDLKTERKDDSAKTTFQLEIEKVPEFTAGSKMFLNPRLYKIWTATLPETENRTQAFYFPFPFIKTDTTIYQLPNDYTIESLPKPKEQKFKYGSFTTNYTYNEKENTITTVAFLELSKNVIPAKDFSNAENFFSSVIKEYTEKIVVKRK